MKIQNNCIYVDICNLLHSTEELNAFMKEIESKLGKECAGIAFFINKKDDFRAPSAELKSLFFDRLKKLDAVTFLICDDFSKIDLELMLMFDIRLGSKPCFLDEVQFTSDCSSRIKMLFGENNRSLVRVLCSDQKSLNELAERYIEKIIGNKDIEQLRALLKCFSHTRGESINESEMLSEESYQFCSLILKKAY